MDEHTLIWIKPTTPEGQVDADWIVSGEFSGRPWKAEVAQDPGDHRWRVKLHWAGWERPILDHDAHEEAADAFRAAQVLLTSAGFLDHDADPLPVKCEGPSDFDPSTLATPRAELTWKRQAGGELVLWAGSPTQNRFHLQVAAEPYPGPGSISTRFFWSGTILEQWALSGLRYEREVRSGPFQTEGYARRDAEGLLVNLGHLAAPGDHFELLPVRES